MPALDNSDEEIVLPAVAPASHTALTNGAARNAATNDGVGAGGEEARGLAATQLLQLRALQLLQRLLQLLLYLCCMLHHTDEAAENCKCL